MKKIIVLFLIIIIGGFMLAENPKVKLSTGQGDIIIELYPEKAPITVENFIAYVNDGFYNNIIFHRVISDFMIQAGGFTSDGEQKKTRPPIKNEADNGLSNEAGTIAMARTPIVDSATSQFFINCKDNLLLNHGVRDFGYCVFGKVIEGIDVVNKIQHSPTGSKKGRQDSPLEDIIIQSAQLLPTQAPEENE